MLQLFVTEVVVSYHLRSYERNWNMMAVLKFKEKCKSLILEQNKKINEPTNKSRNELTVPPLPDISN